MLRAAASLMLLITLVLRAHATDAPRLKDFVVVPGELVRIGDLVDGAGVAAGVAVFRAPDLGQTGVVSVERVAQALGEHGILDLDAHGLSEVVVMRPSRIIRSAQIRERIAAALSGRFGFGDAKNLDITLDRDFGAFHVEQSASTDLVVTRLSVDPRSGHFVIAFDVPGSDAARRMPLRFSGTATETVDAAVLTRSVARGEILRASDVVVDRRPRTEVGGDTVGIKQAVGLAARRPLSSGHALNHADLVKPQIVQRNEPITIIYEIPGIALTVRGKALEAGAIGDVISVVNTQSNRTLQGTVAGPGRVTIMAPLPRLAVADIPAVPQAAPKSAE